MSDILELLSEGVAQDEILEDFPDLELDEIRACLEWHKDKDRFLQQKMVGAASRRDFGPGLHSHLKVSWMRLF